MPRMLTALKYPVSFCRTPCRTARQNLNSSALSAATIHLDGVASLDLCVETLKMVTRRYAKRQITWFTAKPYVSWLTCDTLSGGEPIVKSFEDIVNNAKTLF